MYFLVKYADKDRKIIKAMVQRGMKPSSIQDLDKYDIVRIKMLSDERMCGFKFKIITKHFVRFQRICKWYAKTLRILRKPRFILNREVGKLINLPIHPFKPGWRLL